MDEYTNDSYLNVMQTPCTDVFKYNNDLAKLNPGIIGYVLHFFPENSSVKTISIEQVIFAYCLLKTYSSDVYLVNLAILSKNV